MADNLQVYGIDFNDVLGIKAIDENGNEIMYRLNAYQAQDWADNSKPVGDLVYEGSTISSILRYKTGLTSISLPNVTTVAAQFAYGCTNLKRFSAPNLTGEIGYILMDCINLDTTVFLPQYTMGTGCFRETKIPYVIVKSIGKYASSSCYHDTELIGCDILNDVISGFNNTFNKCSKFAVLVLRSTTLVPLVTMNSFDATPFASNGTGGTLYVPSSLISSYQQASNWSTILSYSNNSIQPLEGSYYSTHYVDGTIIQ